MCREPLNANSIYDVPEVFSSCGHEICRTCSNVFWKNATPDDTVGIPATDAKLDPYNSVFCPICATLTAKRYRQRMRDEEEGKKKKRRLPP
jgi:hypothetical protein